MNRTGIINYLIKKNKYKNYLEIGVYNKDWNYNLIHVKNKTCVDPEPNCKADHVLTSDDFFLRNQNNYDIVFIDGLHLKEQVIKDIKNSLLFLNEGGIIVCHDCLPTSFSDQIETYDGISCWTGTVWQAIAELRMTNKNIDIKTIDSDLGCGLIKKGKQDLFINKNNEEVNYDFFVKYRNELMNVIKVEEFLKLY